MCAVLERLFWWLCVRLDWREKGSLLVSQVVPVGLRRVLFLSEV